MLRYATEVERNVNEERGREKGTRKRDSEQQEGSASSAISYASMVHGMAVHGAVMHIMGGMCTCRRSQLFDTAAGRYTCRRYLLHASRTGLWLTPSFSAWFRPCIPLLSTLATFADVLLIDNFAAGTKSPAAEWSIAFQNVKAKYKTSLWVKRLNGGKCRWYWSRGSIIEVNLL